jgi:hypothetical protein
VLDTRTAQTTLEDALRDAILLAMGKRLAAVASVAELRNVATVGAGSGTKRTDDDLIPIVVAGLVTKHYRWKSTSTAADDSVDVVKPADVLLTAPGRWLSWTSPLRFSPVAGGNSFYLHEIAVGKVQRVIILDKSMSEDEITALLIGAVPAVVVEATDDNPVDATYVTGYRWFTDYKFTVASVAQNLRDRREAAQGSAVSGETEPGANSIDGFIKALLGGTQLFAVVPGIRNIQVGRGYNWVSSLGQRRIIRSRAFNLQVTEANPSAPNDTGPAEEVDTQAEMTAVGATDGPFDMANYLISGATVSEGPGLSRVVQAGSAIIDSAPVTYAGQIYGFPASSDTYRDLLPDGSMAFLSVGIRGAEPALTATAMRIGVTTTDGSGVTNDKILSRTRTPYLANYRIPLT